MSKWLGKRYDFHCCSTSELLSTCHTHHNRDPEMFSFQCHRWKCKQIMRYVSTTKLHFVSVLYVLSHKLPVQNSTCHSPVYYKILIKTNSPLLKLLPFSREINITLLHYILFEKKKCLFHILLWFYGNQLFITALFYLQTSLSWEAVFKRLDRTLRGNEM